MAGGDGRRGDRSWIGGAESRKSWEEGAGWRMDGGGGVWAGKVGLAGGGRVVGRGRCLVSNHTAPLTAIPSNTVPHTIANRSNRGITTIVALFWVPFRACFDVSGGHVSVPFSVASCASASLP